MSISNLDTSYVTFPCTNESLDAIVHSLDISPEDNVLAIGGSGDPAFALLEYANSVAVLDIDPVQRDFIGNRLDLLKQGDVSSFVWPLNNELDEQEKFELLRRKYGVNKNCGRRNSRNDYFFEEGRFERIREKAEQFELLPPLDFSEIIGNVSEEGLIFNGLNMNKVYLSNALFFSKTDTSKEEGFRNGLVNGLVNALPNGSLIYVADDVHFINGAYNWVEGLTIDEILTQESSDIQRRDKGYRNWTLTVLRIKK
ncbi:hypothetical protein HOM13_02815 [Candidatus Woesearchaeota archaeon]|nr:hypothetical protein [Candidatus Woesearchaeota archaeon]MBT5215643.1 hypothetical protein [Candidatus Woesearchaeota archaeon]MBT6402466.1 hypothetical protein [Candidatus Woesearchaeota archaeon]